MVPLATRHQTTKTTAVGTLSGLNKNERADTSRSACRRCFFLKGVLALLPVAGLALVEVGLRLGGYGYPTDFFLAMEWEGRAVWVENEKYGWRFFPPKIARAPQPMVVERDKPPGVVRVVVLGESAALGDPEPAYAFGRHLEVLLSERHPGKQFEVVNAAMTAINSHVIRLIAQDCGKLQADYWVLYMGNNEVVGPYGSGTVFGAQAPSLPLIRAALWWRTMKLGQLTDDIRPRLLNSRGMPAEWGGLEMFLEHKQRYDAPTMEVVYGHFARNLADILEAGRRSGARVLVATVAANLKDCAPFASEHRPDLSAEAREQWRNLVQKGVALVREGKPMEALSQWQSAMNLDKDYAELEWRVAETQWALGRFRLARASYQMALDLDALRFRVDSRLNEITRRVAGSRTNEGIYLVEGERAIARASPQQVPGKELFWDHVHLNFEGNYLLARAVAEQLSPLLGVAEAAASSVSTTSTHRVRWPSSAVVANQLALTDWDRLQVTTEMKRRLQQPPFTLQLNHEAQLRHIRQLEEALKPRTASVALREQLALYESALTARPKDTVLRARYARLLEEAGDLAGALAQWQTVEASKPHWGQPSYAQGRLLLGLGRREEALGKFQDALQRQPEAAEAWNGLGLCQLEAGNLEAAVTLFQRALRQQPRDADFHYNLGIALARQGRTNEAVASYRQAVAVFEEHLGARYNLANLLFRQGRWAEAEKEFQQLLQHSPGHGRARNNYGALLLRQGRAAEAAAQFNEAVRHEPDNVEARYNLASALMSMGRWDEAIPHLEAVLARNPNQAAARQKLEEARRRQAAGGGAGGMP